MAKIPEGRPLTLVELMSWDVRQSGGAEGLLRGLNDFMLRNSPVPLRVHLIYRAGGPGGSWQEQFPRGLLVRHELPLRERGVGSLAARTADFYRAVAAVRREEPVDVLHVHDLVPFDTKAAACWAGLRLGIPWTATSEWTMSWNPLSPRVFLDTLTAWFFCAGAAGLIGLSEGALRGLGGRTFFSACGVDADFFSPGKGDGAGFRLRHNIPSGGPLFFYPARFERRKGQDTLLAVAERLRTSPGMEGFRFVLMGRTGEAGYLDRLKARVGQRGLERHFLFLPPGGPDEVRGGLAAADVMVFPSDREGLGIIALEAMAMGKPVVASDIPGIDEAVRHGETGFLVPRGNAGMMAEKLLALMADPGLRKAMGEAGRRRVERHWTAAETGKKHLDLYMRLAEKTKQGGPT